PPTPPSRRPRRPGPALPRRRGVRCTSGRRSSAPRRRLHRRPRRRCSSASRCSSPRRSPPVLHGKEDSPQRHKGHKKRQRRKKKKRGTATRSPFFIFPLFFVFLCVLCAFVVNPLHPASFSAASFFASASASGSFDGSVPPPWAISGRPPPLPPTAFAATPTRSPAFRPFLTAPSPTAPHRPTL